MVNFKYDLRRLIGFGLVVIVFISIKAIRHYYGKTIIDEVADNHNLNIFFLIVSVVSLIIPVSFSKSLSERDLHKAFEDERKRQKEEERLRKQNERLEKQARF